MANSYSLEYSKLTTESRSKSRARGGILALMLASAKSNIEKSKLVNKAGVARGTASRYVELLSNSGLLRLVESGESGDIYHTTPRGAAFLELFQDLRRLDDHRSSARLMRGQVLSGYYPCEFCDPHPMFPGVHPLTLHDKEGRCAKCHNIAQVARVILKASTSKENC
jgi:predicted transcriptional regulator